MTKNAPHSEQTPASTGYEMKDVSLKSIFVWMISIIVVVAVSLVFLNEYFLAVKEDLLYEMVLSPESLPLRDLRAKEDEMLNSYKLLDSANGVYRIPIERAMELVAESSYIASGK